MNESEKILNEFSTKKSQVLYLLDKYPSTRNSDFLLIYLWLKEFGGLDLPFIEWENVKALGTLETLSRVRRKIQNEEGRYLPSDNIRAERERKRKIITDNIRRF